MVLKIYQVDAFHHQVLRGNPAAVIPLAQWLPDEQLLAIAQENNLSETAYFLPEQNGMIPLRWFTPVDEVRLCGHATLATSHVLFHEMGFTHDQVVFSTLSGPLYVSRKNTGYRMDFPADPPQVVPIPEVLIEALGFIPEEVYAGKDDFLAIAADQATIENLNPDQNLLLQVENRGVIVSAPGEEVDFVSRCFFPRHGIPEDPVTGSAHTLMTPYWASRLDKTELNAIQWSARRGLLRCILQDDRVILEGDAVTYMKGEVFLD